MWKWLKERIRIRALRSDEVPVISETAPAPTGRVTVLYAKFEHHAEATGTPPLYERCHPPTAPRKAPPTKTRKVPPTKDSLEVRKVPPTTRTRNTQKVPPTKDSLAFHKKPVPPSLRQQQRRKRELRFRHPFAEMYGYESRLLLAIHRTTIGAMAAESPAALMRDLRRFSLSTRGQRILRGRPLPESAKVRTWVIEARRRIAAELDTMPASPR